VVAAGGKRGYGVRGISLTDNLICIYLAESRDKRVDEQLRPHVGYLQLDNGSRSNVKSKTNRVNPERR